MIASDAQLAPALEAAYPQKYLQVGPGQWLVASSGTAIDVSTALGITGGRNGGGVVVSVPGYEQVEHFWNDVSVWEKAARHARHD